jgi:hypothetical protein
MIKITSTPQRRAIYKRIAAESFEDDTHPDTGTLLKKLMVVRDVKTRWNYTHAMIKRACVLSPVSYAVVFLDLNDIDLAGCQPMG